ncbi:MAG: sialidase family protein [Armatimonadota bacterium]
MTLTKIEDIVIYRDEAFYSSFPSVVCRPDGDLLLAFRRAPERRMRPGGSVTHSDPNSWIMQIRSDDNAVTWTRDPEPLFIHPRAGNQDPCLMQLDDGTLLCSTFSWELLCDADVLDDLPAARRGPTGWWMTNLGACVVRSEDGGETWSGPHYVGALPGAANRDIGITSRGACRGRMAQRDDGTVLFAVYGAAEADLPRCAYLYASDDRGKSWEYVSQIASDDTVSFNEPHLHITPSGTVVCLMRTADMDGYLAVTQSTDGGQTWEDWRPSGIWGHPFTTAPTPGGNVLVAWGHRRPEYGIRCKLVDAEFQSLETSEEIVLRDDGDNGDIGYPWAVQMADGRMLVAYYFNHDDGTRYIAGTVVEIDE